MCFKSIIYSSGVGKKHYTSRENAGLCILLAGLLKHMNRIQFRVGYDRIRMQNLKAGSQLSSSGIRANSETILSTAKLNGQSCSAFWASVLIFPAASVVSVTAGLSMTELVKEIRQKKCWHEMCIVCFRQETKKLWRPNQRAIL